MMESGASVTLKGIVKETNRRETLQGTHFRLAITSNLSYVSSDPTVTRTLEGPVQGCCANLPNLSTMPECEATPLIAHTIAVNVPFPLDLLWWASRDMEPVPLVNVDALARRVAELASSEKHGDAEGVRVTMLFLIKKTVTIPKEEFERRDVEQMNTQLRLEKIQQILYKPRAWASAQTQSRRSRSSYQLPPNRFQFKKVQRNFEQGRRVVQLADEIGKMKLNSADP